MRQEEPYEIGQTYPLEQRQGIIGEKLETPVWHALTVPSMKERAASEMLKQTGTFAFYPQRDKTYEHRGKLHTRSLPIVTRIIYAKFRHEPRWHVMKDRRILSGVFTSNGWPIVIPGEIIKQVRGMQTEIDKLAAAQAEMKRLREGDRAKFIEGPLAVDGFFVDIMQVKDGMAWFEAITEGGVISGTTGAAMLERKNEEY